MLNSTIGFHCAMSFLIKITHFFAKIVQYCTKLALMDSKTKSWMFWPCIFTICILHPLLIINILYKYFVSRATFKRQPNYSNGYLIPKPNEKQKLHLISFRYTHIRMNTSMLASPFQWVALPTLLQYFMGTSQSRIGCTKLKLWWHLN